MLMLLPPSESKRAGGRGKARLQLSSLRFPELLPQREQTARSLVELASQPDLEESARLLGVPRTLVSELASNASLFDSPLLPAVDRYTGVLYDALDAASLPAESRRHLGRTVAIHSAVFGPVGALDRIPDYRMSAASRLPGIRLRALWAPAITRALAEVPGPIIDLRSEAYASLGPTGDREDAAFVRVVSVTPEGTRRALNHFNKHAKGLLVRAFVLQRPRLRSVAGFVAWARSAGFEMESGANHEVQLVAD
jgi:cytoplasmic iron level regulating protein YaaA (DUF328/UPF0246 family)